MALSSTDIVGAAPSARAAGAAVPQIRVFAGKRLKQQKCSVARSSFQPRVVCTAAPSSITKPLQLVNSTVDNSINDFKRGLISQYVEHACWLDDIEGQIPPEIEGTLLRNGPGLFESGDGQEINRFDADGMICMYAIRDGRVFFRNKFIRTKGFLEEQRAGKRLYRGVFTSEKGNFFQNPLKLKNTANTGVIFWGGHMLALTQNFKPYELDQELNTLREYEAFPADGTCSDYVIRYDTDGSKKLVFFHPQGRGLYTNLKIWEVNEQFETVAVQEVDLPVSFMEQLLFHKISMTENYYVLYANSMSIDFFKYLTDSLHGSVSLFQCFKFDTRKSRLHVIPRPGRQNSTKYWSEKPRAFAISPSCFIFHNANCYEMDGGRYLIFDTIPRKDDRLFNNENEDQGNMVDTGISGYSRFCIDLLTGEVSESTVDIKDIEFPSVNQAVGGTPHHHTYFIGSQKDSANGQIMYLLKLSIDPAMSIHVPFNSKQVEKDLWMARPRSMLQEPVYVPKKDAKKEDDGWIFIVCFNTDMVKNDLLIFDATKISDGPVAKVHLPFHIPYEFHGSFTETYMGPQNDHFVPNSYDIREGV